ncbi:hypothetical protein D3C81_240430 [compost metagenome]
MPALWQPIYSSPRHSADHSPSFIYLLTATADSIDHRLTGQPGYSASLKRCREVSRHSVSFFKQSPEHHDGRGSCLALLGSDGVAGGSVAVPQSGDFPAQPASSRLSSIGAALGQLQLLSCTLSLLVRHGLAALFFGSGLGCGAPVALGHLQAVVGQGLIGPCRFRPRISRSTISNHNPVLLATGDQHQSDQPPAPGRYRVDPVHASTPPSSTHRPSSLSRRCGFWP